MEGHPEEAVAVRSHFRVLIRFRALQLRNALDTHLRDAPVRSFAVLVMLLVIWIALYWVLTLVLRQVSRWELIAVVANQHIFVHFFLVLALMLALSNAILAFGSLFGRHEAGYLLTMPVPARQAICLKWLEGMFLSSWSFLLLGVPLMFAVGRNTTVDWFYYPLFVGHFLGFILIPATLGLLAAWAVAMWAPRRPLAIAVWSVVVIVAVGLLWGWSLMRNAELTEEWLRKFFGQLSLARQPLLPSTWSAKGIVAAMQERPDESLFYLGVVLANAAFLAWVTVNIVGRTWAQAYDRAHRARPQSLARRGRLTAFACAVAFFYLPQRLRMLMLKDMRSFSRDPTQWTQMVIMMGLLVVYAANLKRLPMDLDVPGMRSLLAFLNLMTVSLILATFTSRFVFPLLSLEGQQLWLLGLLPTGRVTILLVKFLFSLVVTACSALLATGLAVRSLGLPPDWVWLQLALCLGVCIGLSGLSVGLGARFPVFSQRNPARIAAGFGGTVNLIASMLFVAAEMACLALVGLSGLRDATPGMDEIQAVAWLAPGSVLFGMAVAAASLWIGARHFERLEY